MITPAATANFHNVKVRRETLSERLRVSVRSVSDCRVFLSICHLAKCQKRPRNAPNLPTKHGSFSNEAWLVGHRGTPCLIFRLRRFTVETSHFWRKSRPFCHLRLAKRHFTLDFLVCNPLIISQKRSERRKSPRGRKVPPRGFRAILARRHKMQV